MKIEYDRQGNIYSERAKSAVTDLTPTGETIGHWRQERVLSRIRPLITPERSWLTVGDGNYGSEASWIIANGGKAHASDYSTPLLEVAHQSGLIGEFSAQNAEALDFEDESFDFVLIKEALHHFPRPWLALYESMRVSRFGVVIFEPNGQEPGILSNVLRVIRGKDYSSYYGFEKVGNFKYAPNPRELEKFLLGMHYINIAFIFYNDFWLSSEADAAPLSGGNDRERFLRSKVLNEIRKRDFFARMRLVPFGKMGCCMLKEGDSDVKRRLKSGGWEWRTLPRNPFRE